MILILALAAAPVVARAAPPCRAERLVLTLGGRAGDFDGMSHSGTLVTLRNRSKQACTLPALPAISMLDARGGVLPIVRQPPPAMYPGPAMVPVRLAPGAVVSTPLRWVSGPVFDRSRCHHPVRLAVRIGAGRLSAPLTAQICGPAGANAGFTQPSLRPGTATGN